MTPRNGQDPASRLYSFLVHGRIDKVKQSLDELGDVEVEVPLLIPEQEVTGFRSLRELHDMALGANGSLLTSDPEDSINSDSPNYLVAHNSILSVAALEADGTRSASIRFIYLLANAFEHEVGIVFFNREKGFTLSKAAVRDYLKATCPEIHEDIVARKKASTQVLTQENQAYQDELDRRWTSFKEKLNQLIVNNQDWIATVTPIRHEYNGTEFYNIEVNLTEGCNPDIAGSRLDILTEELQGYITDHNLPARLNIYSPQINTYRANQERSGPTIQDR